MDIIDVVSGSAPLGEHCQVCNKLIGIPSKVLEFTYYDDAYGDIDGYICKSCIDKAHKGMGKAWNGKVLDSGHRGL